jgi:DNA-directed RNA polymerase specialized sigma24 family protein
MTKPTPPYPTSLDRYREYLRSQTKAAVGAQLRAEIHPSDIVPETLLKARRAGDQFGANSEQQWFASPVTIYDQVAMQNEWLLQLLRELNLLPDDQRELLEMKYLQGLTVAEIADCSGRSKALVVKPVYQGM